MSTGFQFGAFELDLDARELRKRGIRLRLGDQSIEFLIALLERPGEIVTREDIRDRLWPGGTIVEFEHGINSAVKRLRDALGESSVTPRFIETLPRRGYRFIGHVASVEAAPADLRLRAPENSGTSETVACPAADSETPPAESGRSAPARLPRHWLWGGAIALALTVAVVAGMGLWKAQSKKPAGVPRIGSIAVLPLSSLSHDPEQKYLADALTDELITELAQIRNLSVISRTSVLKYRDAKRSAREIGKELNVDAILEGSLAGSGNLIRITAQLIDCASDRHFWARRFDREMKDLLTVQLDVARAVALEVQGSLGALDGAYTGGSRPANPAAYEASLRALFFLNGPRGGDYAKGVEYLERAVQLDPGYALAWARLAHIRAERDFGQDLPPSDGFLAALKKANELGQSLAEARMVNGDFEFFWKWDFAKGETEFRRAAELNPGVAGVRRHLGYCYWMLGRKTEALPELERSRELDPYSLNANATLGELLLNLGWNEQAIRQFERTAALYPGHPRAYLGLARAYRNTGKLEDAALNLLKSASLGGAGADSVAALDVAFRRGGVQALWKAFHRLRIEQLQKRSLAQRVSPVKFAIEYGAAGDKEQAIEWLRRAFRERCPHLPWIREEQAFAEMKSDPRLQEILRGMTLQ